MPETGPWTRCSSGSQWTGTLNLLLPPNHKLREERERAIDHTRAADFYEKLPGAAILPGSACDRHSAPARPRSPPVRALPAGGSRIHWGLIRPYDAHAEFGELVARPQDKAARHNSVDSSVWQRAEACNRSRAREPDAPSASYPRPHQRSDSSNLPRSWAPQSRTPRLQPSPSDPHHRATQQPGHAEPSGHRAARPGSPRPRPRVPSAAATRALGSATRRPHQRISAERGLPHAFYFAARAKQKPANSRIPRGCGTSPVHLPRPPTLADVCQSERAYTGPWGPSTGPSPTWHQPAQPQPGLHWGKHHWEYTGTALRSGGSRPQPLAWEHANGSGRRTSTGLPSTGIPHGSQPLADS